MVDGRQRDAETQLAWARLLVSAFADAGVRHVVLSPGSRSTPFVLAASGEERLAIHDVIDERAAGFFALGQARESGVPSLLLCTSGTAAAHYLPAVIEAAMASIPMLVLSADRPVELVDCGANQTIDQLKLFGDHARDFVDLGTASARPGALRAARRAAVQAAWTARWPRAGAVHLTPRPRTPLGAAYVPRPGYPVARRGAMPDRPAPRPSMPGRRPEAAALDRLADACRRTERGLLVAG
ncbi:MAG: thiamine pyrophosphate-binding protein, partial [Acidobacteriota bacterium]